MSEGNYCKQLWRSPLKNPASGRAFRARSPALARMIKECRGSWSEDDCSVFNRFGQMYSPLGRRLQEGVRGKWHRKCSPLRGRRRLSKSPKKSPRKSPKKSPKKSPMRASASITKSYCDGMGLSFRKAACVSKRKRKSKSPKKSRAVKRRFPASIDPSMEV